MWTAIGLILVIGIGLSMRLYKLDKPVMWCDEAESAINALTILENGVPTSHYLGQPIYENILTEPWPENNEYEFKDSSYSKKGLAIYHGWLPLYSIAGSLKAFGIEPDTNTAALTPQHTVDEMSRRTIAARLPSVIASVFFMLLLFYCGREMYGDDAGWAAIIVAAVAVPMVNIGRQARYYSLTAALSVACCLAGWRLYQRGYWRDFIFAGVVFALLFHTHILTFAIACVACSTLLPFLFRHEKAFYKMLMCAGIIAAGIVPWIIGTGFMDQAQSIPKAISTMQLPWDLLAWPARYWELTTILLGGMIFIVLMHVRPKWFAQRLHDAYAEHRAAFYFLSLWILIAFVMFMTLIPAASLFFQRLYLGAIGPGIIFGAMIFAGLGRALGRRVGVSFAVIAFVAFAVINTHTMYTWNRQLNQAERYAFFLKDAANWNLKPGTKLYSQPSDQLTMMYYSGMPIQSIAPVRKSFLDEYPGDVVLIMATVPVWPVWEEQVKYAAWLLGGELTDKEAEEWSVRLNRIGVARKLAGEARSITPAVDEQIPLWGEMLLAWQVNKTKTFREAYDYNKINPAVFRGFEYGDHMAMWKVFFYRFVDPHERIDNPNYQDRLLRGEARVLPSLWTVYTSPGTGNGLNHQASVEEKK